MKNFLLLALTVIGVSGCLRDNPWTSEKNNPGPVLSNLSIQGGVTAVYPEETFVISIQWSDPQGDITTAVLMDDPDDVTTHNEVDISEAVPSGATSGVLEFYLWDDTAYAERTTLPFYIKLIDAGNNTSNVLEGTMDIIPWVPSLKTDFSDNPRYFDGTVSTVELYAFTGSSSGNQWASWTAYPKDQNNYDTISCVGSVTSATTFKIETCWWDYDGDNLIEISVGEGYFDAFGAGRIVGASLEITSWVDPETLANYYFNSNYTLDKTALPTAALTTPVKEGLGLVKVENRGLHFSMQEIQAKPDQP